MKKFKSVPSESKLFYSGKDNLPKKGLRKLKAGFSEEKKPSFHYSCYVLQSYFCENMLAPEISVLQLVYRSSRLVVVREKGILSKTLKLHGILFVVKLHFKEIFL